MFDATYFRSGLQAHAESAGAKVWVELYIIGGQAHRVRSVDEVRDNYVVLDVYQRRGESSGAKNHWFGAPSSELAAEDTHRAVISYESIAQVVITPAEAGESGRIGFTSR